MPHLAVVFRLVVERGTTKRFTACLQSPPCVDTLSLHDLDQGHRGDRAPTLVSRLELQSETLTRRVLIENGRAVGIEALERFDFYAAARRAFAVVRTSDPGPYGCFILRKGVI